MGVILPKVDLMCVEGFDKIFKNDIVQIDFSKSLNILLGGNGLGKTTLLQCIVYGLTGGTNIPEVELLKAFRWDHNFFRKRVKVERQQDARITIEFSMSEKKFKVVRGLQGSRVVTFSIDNIIQTDIKYEDAIIEYGKYDNFNSFVFIVSRLLYLPENRRSLMWDYDAQVRALMILSNDLINEEEYRNLRLQIKNMDSAKRHTIVRINKIKDVLAQKTDGEEIKEFSDHKVEEVQSALIKKRELSEKLQILLEQKGKALNELKNYEGRREEIISEICELSVFLRKNESKVINQSIEKFGKKQGMFLDKVVNYGICPCCGRLDHNFQKIAKRRIEHGECLICGNDNSLSAVNEVDIEAMQVQLQEKISARDNINKYMYQLNNTMKSIDDDIFEVRQEINGIEYGEFVNADRADDVFETDDEDSEAELLKLTSDRQSLENDIQNKQEQADNMYKNFLNCFEDRNKKLSEIYERLSTDFMGKKVTLEYEKSTDRFVDIDYLIPKFDDEIRKSAEDCSEAQRFFLDIAFRMSLIILNKELTGESGTFICETPESALDISYVKNVVKMFCQFMDNNSLILSNNLQRLGLAQELTAAWDRENTSIFDLLEHGKLSEVQKNSSELFAIRDEILKVGN